jgi:hypothetical protein
LEFEGCTLTQGYWKNHNSEARGGRRVMWPLYNVVEPNNQEEAHLCGMEWLDILETPTTGNAWMILAHQYIAAALNVANGATAPGLVDLAQAEIYLEGNCGTISPSTTLGSQMVELSTILDNFNNGLIGPGHCDDGDDTDDKDYCRDWD